MNLTAIILANAAIFLAVLVQASTGIGFAMIAVPLLVLIDLVFVPGPVLMILLVLGIWMGFQERDHIDWQGLPALLPGMLLGTLMAAYLMQHIDADKAGLVFGSILILALIIVATNRPVPRHKAAMAAGGLVSGLMGTISGIHGPALAVLYQAVPLATARATIALIFVLSAIAALALLTMQGFLNKEHWQLGFWLLPGMLLALPMATLLRGRLPVLWLKRGMLILVAISAIMLIQESIL